MQVRKILLKKYLPSPSPHDTENTPNGCSRWIALGHFDEIYTFNDSMSSGFDDIQKSNNELIYINDEANCFHPLYLIIPKHTREEEIFWQTSLWHIAITRIHFSRTDDPLKQFQKLKEKVSNEFRLKPHLYHFYYTTELSDMVLVQKSNNLHDLLTDSLNLRKYAEVGRTYTYVGLNYEKIIQTPYPNKQEQIPFFAIRFAVSTPRNASACLSEIKEYLGQDLEYSVTGIDDIVINFNDLYVKDLVRLYRAWYGTDNLAIDRMLSAFSEITTRVGVAYNGQEDNDAKEKDPQIQSECQKMLAYISEIQKYIQYYSDRSGKPKEGWLKPILEISKTLVRMSQTAVLDEFVYLLMPGIGAFLTNILDLLKTNKNLSDDPIATEMCNELVEECSHLLEQIMRIEGQLANQPELRPIEYDIPVFLLEYTLAFLNDVVVLLQKNDDVPGATIKFLIVPRLCEKISAMELFRAQKDTHSPGLVLLNIPIKRLYEPVAALRALCHETAHFAGEKSRLRGFRQRQYTCAAAVLLARSFFDSIDDTLIRNIERGLTQALAAVDIRCIEDIYNETLLFTEKLAYDNNYYLTHIWECMSCAESRDQIRMLSYDERLIEKKSVQRYLKDIKILFREVYADLCMLRILNLGAAEYVNALIEESYSDWAEGTEHFVLQFAIRVYAVLAARKQYCKCKNVVPKSRYGSVWKKALKMMKAFHEEIASGVDGINHLPIPTSCIYAVVRYAQACNKELEGLDETLVASTKELYINAEQGIADYAEALKTIGESRKRIFIS